MLRTDQFPGQREKNLTIKGTLKYQYTCQLPEGLKFSQQMGKYNNETQSLPSHVFHASQEHYTFTSCHSTNQIH
jgi:hypothetical protein